MSWKQEKQQMKIQLSGIRSQLLERVIKEFGKIIDIRFGGETIEIDAEIEKYFLDFIRKCSRPSALLKVPKNELLVKIMATKFKKD